VDLQERARTMLMYIRNVMKREEGATAVEYGLMVAAIAAVIVVVVFALGRIVNSKFEKTCNAIKSGGSNTTTTGCT
jgi:pilus assembly protein Flp/PilA